MLDRLRRFAPLAGAVFFLLTLVSFFTSHSSPSASASGEKVISFDVDHRSSQRVSDILLGVALVFFVSSLYGYLRRSPSAGTMPPAVARRGADLHDRLHPLRGHRRLTGRRSQQAQPVNRSGAQHPRQRPVPSACGRCDHVRHRHGACHRAQRVTAGVAWIGGSRLWHPGRHARRPRRALRAAGLDARSEHPRLSA